MTALASYQTLALVCVLYGLTVFTAMGTGLIAPRSAIILSLDFWSAAGIVRLSGHPDWPAILTAAGIIALRKMTAAGLRAASRAN